MNIIELAKQAGFTANDEQEVFLRIYRKEIERFATIIRNEALEEAERGIKALRADVAEWKARADDLAAALNKCINLAYKRDQDELPSAIITTASNAVAKYNMLVDFSDALGD